MTGHTPPDGWRRVRFGDVVREVKVATRNPKADGLTRVVGLEHLDSESLPLRRWNELADLGDGTSFTRVFRAGQVLFGKRRAYQRKVAVADFDGICSSDILVFEPSTDELVREFLPYLVQSDGFFDHALGTSAGSLSPRTKFKELARYEFALPPVPEQEVIVRTLQATAEATDRVESVLAATNDLAMSLVDAVEKEANDWVTLDEVLREPPRNGLTIQPTESETGVRSLTIGSVTETGYAPEGDRFIYPPHDAERFLVEPGDLFVTRSNTLDRVGLPALVPAGTSAPLYYSDLLVRLRLRENILPAALLEHLLRSPRARGFVRSIAAGTSASMKKINGRNLRRMPIPRLSPPVSTDLLDRLMSISDARSTTIQHLRDVSTVQRLTRETLLGGEGQ